MTEYIGSFIKGYPYYNITTTGMVWSWKSLRFLKPGSRNMCGHQCVTLWGRGKEHKSHYIHRLVLETFVGPCPTGMECRHLDGNPRNNVLDNLKWGTKKENSEDSRKHGAMAYGQRVGTAKLCAQDVLEIRQLYKAGCWLHRELAELYGVARPTISGIIRGETWCQSN